MAYVCCFSNMRFCSCPTVLSVLGAQNTQNRPQPPLFPQPPVRSRRVSFHDSFCTSFVVPNLEPIWAYFGSQFRSKKHTESKSWFYTFYDRFFETLLIEIWVHFGLMLKRFESRARLSLIQQNYQKTLVCQWFCYVWGVRKSRKNNIVATWRWDFQDISDRTRKLVQFWPENGSKMCPKTASEIVFKLSFICECFLEPERAPKWSQNGAKIDPKPVLGPSWGHLGPSWVLVGPSWAIFGTMFGPRWYHFGVIVGSLWGHPGASVHVGELSKQHAR